MKKQTLLFFSIFLFIPLLKAQTGKISGIISSEKTPVEFAYVKLKEVDKNTYTDSTGFFGFNNLQKGTYTIFIQTIGYLPKEIVVELKSEEKKSLNLEIEPEQKLLDEVVISGTLKEVSKSDSPVPVEVYSADFFKANPNPSIFEALQNVNGVRPQVNCNVCNTGDIHINGLEGPYTMILIDGMPIVSGLASVYGLSGIPQSLIERVEIVKGPASTLYGSEAVGGLINVITKTPSKAPLLSVESFATTWGEVNTDVGIKLNAGQKANALVGINHFYYDNPIDNNNDGFTDLTIQKRFSLFNKWQIKRKNNRLASFVGRYVYEDRWGGEMNWTPQFRGGDSIYGESIYTNRWEFFGTYELPTHQPLFFTFSANSHQQNSYYGNTFYLADQRILFGQLTWKKVVNKHHNILLGSTIRYTYYDDNTPATAIFDTVGVSENRNEPSKIYLPGFFAQDEITLTNEQTLLLGLRYDYNSVHGNILTPRANYKYRSTNKKNILRIGVGNGYRVANVFTEDHAALTGSRDVVFLADLKPETSWNLNTNYVRNIYPTDKWFISFDGTIFYTYFSNRIFADYDANPNLIIYDNLDGYSISRGVSLNAEFNYDNRLTILLGATAMDVFLVDNGVKERQEFTERYTGVWNIGYNIDKYNITIDYTGNLYGPMRLPLLSDFDPRSEFSPWWSIQNIQLTKRFKNRIEVFGGVKNLLNWTPAKGEPFIIARSHDPFDEDVIFNADGSVQRTTDNPYALTFDPTYVYGPNQGIRFFLGLRYEIN